MCALSFLLGLVEPRAFVHLSGFRNHDWICLFHLSKRHQNKAKSPALSPPTQLYIKIRFTYHCYRIVRNTKVRENLNNSVVTKGYFNCYFNLNAGL